MHVQRTVRHLAVALAGLLAAGTVAASPVAAAPGKPVPTPPPVVTSQPTNPTGERYATFTWTPEPSTAYTCSLDGMAPTTCSGGQQVYGPLTDGVHSFSLRAKLTGKSKPSTYRYSWRVAGTPPGAPTVAPVSSPTSSTTVTVSFSNTDPSAVGHQCSLDGGPYAACSSPHVVSAATEGSHTVDVRAVNAFGTTSTPASVSWVLDSTAPANVTLLGPAGYTRDTAPVVEFSADGATSYDCSVDGETPVTCSSPYVVPGVATDGAHSLTVRAFDAVGNAAQPATALWVLDTTPPAKPLIVTGPADRTNQTTATFEVWSDDSGTLECALDGDPWQACTSPVQYSGLGSGAHTLQVRGQDAVGNTSDVDSATWEIDTDAPIPPVITDGPTSPSSNAQPLLTFDTEDTSAVSFRCSLDGQTAVDCVSDAWPFGPLSTDGLHTFRVVAVDDLGNLSGAASWSWILDTTAPPVPVFSSKPAVSGTDTTAVFAFTAEPGAGYLCTVDGAAEDVCTSPVTLRDLPLGAHTFSVRAEDAAHNRSQPAQHTWTVVAEDTTPVPPSPPAPPADPAPVAPAPPAPVVGSAAKPATTASITADPALKGTSTVAFSGDVRNVTSSSVLLTVAGSTSGVAAGLSCRTAAGSAADCASGAVRTVKVAPVRPLVPGQTYVLSVTSGVVDGSGSAVTPVAKSFRASTEEQETSLRAASTWQKGKSSGALGRRYVTDNRAGAAVSLTVRGSKVTWFTMTGPAQGKATVYVDGVEKARVDTYSPVARWKVAKTLKGLGKGTHQLRIVVAGRKSKASKGTGVVVDAVRSGAKLVANPRSRTSWGVAKTSTASGGSYAVTGLKGATSSFTFKGTSVSWVTAKAPSMGKAKVYVDGVLKASVDNFSKRSVFSVRRTLTGLSDGTHTVKVVVTGTKRRAARGTDVVVDKWVVG